MNRGNANYKALPEAKTFTDTEYGVAHTINTYMDVLTSHYKTRNLDGTLTTIGLILLDIYADLKR